MNKGKGAGIQSALKIATGEYFVIQDADLEYDPAEIPNLLKFAKQNDYDAVYGSRFLGNIHRMPRANYIANRAYNIILRILYNTNITDMHTCYKMVRTSLLKKLGIVSNGFGYATELVSKLLKSGVIIYEIPISFNGRTKQEGKKIDIMDGLECAYKLISYRYGKNDTPFTVKRTTVTRFILVGGLGFLTNYALLVLLTELTNLGYILAEIIAALIALHVTFVFHDQWTYRLYTPPGTAMFGFKTRYVTYVFSNALGSLFTVVSFSVLFNYLDRLLSLVIAAIIGVCWNYAANTFIIWRKKN
jgi:putative flippase GtrA